jgi:tetratricopeptide (TPR) repeat protein
MPTSREILRSSRGHWLLVLELIGLVGLWPIGCLPFRQLSITSAERPGVPVKSKQVVTGGACLVLGEAEKPALSREMFFRRVNDLLAAERFESARRFIRRYPDLARETLRNATNADAGSAALQLIAQVHDQQCGSSDPAESWLALLQQRAAHPELFVAYERARQQFLDLLHNGRAQEAITLLSGRRAPAVLLEIDAHQLLGEASLLNDKPAEAVASLAKALEYAQSDHPYQAVQVMLLLGEAERRAGKTAEGTGTWQQAVLLCGQLVTRPVPVRDPMLWERASYVRPAQSSWPDPVLKQLIPPDTQARTPVQPASAQTGLDEAWLWVHVGRWHLERNESQAALIAFKRAESLSIDQHFQEQMQLLQARALIQLQQRDAAMGLLTRLGSNQNSPTAAPALAMLGSAKLQDGSPEQTLALLKKAVEESPSTSWPGRGEAEADLGLAYLMTGNEAAGLRWLHSGQRRFEAAQDHEVLVLSLNNEALYFENTKRPADAARIRERVKLLEKN